MKLVDDIVKVIEDHSKTSAPGMDCICGWKVNHGYTFDQHVATMILLCGDHQRNVENTVREKVRTETFDEARKAAMTFIGDLPYWKDRDGGEYVDMTRNELQQEVGKELRRVQRAGSTSPLPAVAPPKPHVAHRPTSRVRPPSTGTGEICVRDDEF